MSIPEDELRKLRQRLEQRCVEIPGKEEPMRITIELADSGMIARYQEPVKHVREEKSYSANIMKSVEMQVFLVGMLEAIGGGDAKPKMIEEWRWEPRTAICKDAQDLATVIEKVRAVRAQAEELRRSGKHILRGLGGYPGGYPGGYLDDCAGVGQAYMAAPVMGMPPSPPDAESGPDYTIAG